MIKKHITMEPSKKKILFTLFLLVFFNINSFSKEIYIYVTDSPLIYRIQINISIDDNELIKMYEDNCWLIDLGDRNTCELKIKSGNYYSSKKIQLDFNNKDDIYVVIELKKETWDIYEQSFPNISPKLKMFKDQSSINTRNKTIIHPNTGLNKNALIEYYHNSKSKIEGIYENTVVTSNFPKYELGLIETEEGFTLIYLNGGDKEYWKIGDVKAYIIKTAEPNLYKVKWYLHDKKISEDLYITFEDNLMKIVWTNGSPEQLYLKIYPVSIKKELNKISSGSGFALTSNGYIVTNYHVIEGSSIIKVKGVNGDFTNSYNARLVVSDKNNDLAIIQIDDTFFTNFNRIPYSINLNLSNVGENVFVLGYPLRSSMGDEIKLTNGIISSKTGYQGDITSYQISAPIQPGNSGGPLFDSKGNIIAIVNAKHSGAQNATYAIKALYLTSLIELLPSPFNLQSINMLTGKSLSQQVELVKNFVYIIEAE